MLKPEKWQTIFDTDGKVVGFQKALKLIVLGVSSGALLMLFPSFYVIQFVLIFSVL